MVGWREWPPVRRPASVTDSGGLSCGGRCWLTELSRLGRAAPRRFLFRATRSAFRSVLNSLFSSSLSLASSFLDSGPAKLGPVRYLDVLLSQCDRLDTFFQLLLKGLQCSRFFYASRFDFDCFRLSFHYSFLDFGIKAELVFVSFLFEGVASIHPQLLDDTLGSIVLPGHDFLLQRVEFLLHIIPGLPQLRHYQLESLRRIRCLTGGGSAGELSSRSG